jgi:hypothetical protein
VVYTLCDLFDSAAVTQGLKGALTGLIITYAGSVACLERPFHAQAFEQGGCPVSRKSRIENAVAKPSPNLIKECKFNVCISGAAVASSRPDVLRRFAAPLKAGCSAAAS